MIPRAHPDREAHHRHRQPTPGSHATLQSTACLAGRVGKEAMEGRRLEEKNLTALVGAVLLFWSGLGPARAALPCPSACLALPCPALQAPGQGTQRERGRLEGAKPNCVS